MPLSETDDALFEKIVGVNLKGTFNTLRVAAKRLRQGGRNEDGIFSLACVKLN